MRNNISVEVPGRICLMGDKVDLLGKPVIGMAIDLMMTINFKERADDTIKFYSHDTNESTIFKVGQSPPLNIDLRYWSVLYERLRDNIKKGFYIEVKSDIPIGAGLSTSAAVSIGFIKAINQAYGLKLTSNEIAELAYLGENHDLGIQCGRLDQYTIAHGGVVFIKTDYENPGVEHLDITDLPIVVGDSMEKRKASSILNRIKKQISDKNPKTLGAFKIIEECVYQARDSLLKEDFKKLGKLMDTQQEQEIILEAATQKILTLCEVSKNAGAFLASKKKLRKQLMMQAGDHGFLISINISID
jgi:mevalonate kinase